MLAGVFVLMMFEVAAIRRPSVFQCKTYFNFNIPFGFPVAFL